MSILTGKSLPLSWPGAVQGSPPDLDLVRWDASYRSESQGANKSLTVVLRLEQNPAPVLTKQTSAALNVPAQILRAAVLVKIVIITGIGVQIQRNVILTGTVPRTVRLPAAQSIVITAAIVGYNSGTASFWNPYPPTNVSATDPVSATVTAVVTDENVDFLGQDAPVWNPGGASASALTTPAGSPIAGPGNLLALNGTITSLGTASALYLWLVDLKDAYVTGFNVTAGGTLYTSTPTPTYAADAGGIDTLAASFPTAPLTATISGGIITAIQFQSGIAQSAYGPFGLGMFASPLVTFAGGGGSGFTATTNVTVVRSSYALPVIGPFTSAPQSFSFQDELKDACSFEAGLGFLLSSDPNNLTLVSGASARIDWKVAQ